MTKRVLLLGGSGFIGRSLAEYLSKQGHQLLVPTRQRERAKHLLVLPACDVIDADVHDNATLMRLMTDIDVVVNLIGVLTGNFEREHVEFPRRVAGACVKSGIGRLIQMSALGASVDAPSEYLRSRAQGEAAVWAIAKTAPGLHVTMFRPSVVFGEHDNFINMLSGLVDKFPVIPLGSAGAKFQPMWVEDVARAIGMSIAMTGCFGGTFELAGPRVYTMGELVRLVIERSGKSRLVVNLPPALSMLQATAFEFPPGRWLGKMLGVTLTRDNVRSMRVPNTSDSPFPALFGKAAALDATLSNATLGNRYSQLRNYAGH